MSVRLPSVDLSTVVVGSTGVLDWSGYGLPTADPRAKLPQLQLFNDSGCALDIRLNSSGRTFYVPPGGWHTAGITLQPLDKSLAWTVVGVIPNSPITTLTAVYWAPGEEVTGIALGNSPVGISGSVTTSSIQSLKNDGQAPGTSIIESTPSDQASSSFALDNDGSGFWQILSAGTLRKLINAVRGNSGGTKATITVGDSGDATITTVYGSIQGGQPASVGALTTGAITGTGANSMDGGNITTDGSGDLTVSKLITVDVNTTGGNDNVLHFGVDPHTSADWYIIVNTNGNFIVFDNKNGRTILDGVLTSGVVQVGTDDAGTKRTIATYEGTTDPAGRVGITVNEGDIWLDG